MKATLTNLAPLPWAHWAVVTFPRPLVATFGAECNFILDDGRMWRAVRGQSIGLKTVYRIFCEMEGLESLQGTLHNTINATAASFALHPWVADDITALIPTFGARVSGLDQWAGGLTINLVDNSDAHQRWWIKRRLPQYGLVMEWWTDIFSLDPVCPIRGKIVWSDRGDPNQNKVFDAFAIKSGELLAFDFGLRNGIQTPLLDREKKWMTLLNDRPVSLGDGSGLPLSGNMLCYVQPKPEDTPPPDPEDFSNWEVAAIRDLQAGAYGDIVGVSHDWEGNYCAQGNLSRFSARYVSAAAARWSLFQDSLKFPAGWFADRPVGLGKTPSQTGAQEDFGAVKGTYAAKELDPRHIQMYQYSVYSELFRGFNHYEADGEPLDLAKHPDWVSWNGVTHYHPGVSKDRLGKDNAFAVASATGWKGYDDQHRSQNGLAAYMTLADDPLMDDQVKLLVTTDRANYRLRFPENGEGAPRAQGRQPGAWAQLFTVTEGETQAHFASIIAQRMIASAAGASMNVTGPIKVLGYGAADGRKAVFDESGNLAPYTSVWEHGLAAVAIYGVLKRFSSDSQAQKVLETICDMLANFGFFEEGSDWYTVDDMWYRDGELLPGGLTSTSKHLKSRIGAGGTASWTFAGVLVAREFLGAGHPRATDMNNYIRAITNNEEADNRITAEWWAAVKSVQAPAI